LPAIYRERDFVVYVNSSDHPPPHCHVWRAGEGWVVYLGTLTARFGPRPLPRYIRDSLAEHIDEIWDAWNERHPPRS
jgi:hypothetical protein